MELLESPNNELWNKRYEWIDNEIALAEKGSHFVSDHAISLFIDLQACYCIGAWLGVVILSVSVIDAHLRENEALDTNIGTAKLLNDYFEGNKNDINWLRRLRNKYVHIDIDNPALNLDIQYEERDELEKNATKAMKIVIEALFQNPGT